MTEQPARGRVVIVGGGFGGLFAARALRGGPFSVTLVDRSPQHVFQPLLYQCATGILSEGQITAPLRRLLRRHRNLRCITAEAVGVDPAGRAVECLRPLGERVSIPYDHLIVAAGVEAPPFAAALATATGATRDRAGRIVVRDDLTIPGHPQISVIGDMMSLRKLPGVAEVAMQSGLYAGRRVRHELTGGGQVNGGQVKPFRYHDLGSAAYLARGRAVVSAGPLRVSGFPGWVIWLFIHIAFLTGYRNRVGAILTWWVAFTRDIRRERAYTTREVGHVRDVYQPSSG